MVPLVRAPGAQPRICRRGGGPAGRCTAHPPGPAMSGLRGLPESPGVGDAGGRDTDHSGAISPSRRLSPAGGAGRVAVVSGGGARHFMPTTTHAGCGNSGNGQITLQSAQPARVRHIPSTQGQESDPSRLRQHGLPRKERRMASLIILATRVFGPSAAEPLFTHGRFHVCRSSRALYPNPETDCSIRYLHPGY